MPKNFQMTSQMKGILMYNKRHPIEQLVRKPIAKEYRRIRTVLREAIRTSHVQKRKIIGRG